MDSRTFYQRVYRIVSEIPAGSVMTYGQIAFYAGKPRAARFVGRAMRLAPPGLPCHRVVGKNGALAPAEAFGGPGPSGPCWNARESLFCPEDASI